MKRGTWLGRIGRWGGAIAILTGGIIAGVFLKAYFEINGVREAEVRTLPPVREAAYAQADNRLYTLGCKGCHTADLGGQVFFEQDGIGRIVAPNLTTLVPEMTDAQLEAAIRQGIGHKGQGLMVMPSRAFQFLTDQETADLIAALRRVPAVDRDPGQNDYGAQFRIGIGLGMVKTQPHYLAEWRDNPLPRVADETKRGHYLVQTVCTECHGPDATGSFNPEFGKVPALDVAGGYDAEQFKTLLRTGVPPSGKDIGVMKEVALNDFQHFSDEDVDAIHDYLTALAASRN